VQGDGLIAVGMFSDKYWYYKICYPDDHHGNPTQEIYVGMDGPYLVDQIRKGHGKQPKGAAYKKVYKRRSDKSFSVFVHMPFFFKYG
jgi:hypothetical protein